MVFLICVKKIRGSAVILKISIINIKIVKNKNFWNHKMTNLSHSLSPLILTECHLWVKICILVFFYTIFCIFSTYFIISLLFILLLLFFYVICTTYMCYILHVLYTRREKFSSCFAHFWHVCLFLFFIPFLFFSVYIHTRTYIRLIRMPRRKSGRVRKGQFTRNYKKGTSTPVTSGDARCHAQFLVVAHLGALARSREDLVASENARVRGCANASERASFTYISSFSSRIFTLACYIRAYDVAVKLT